jgi:phosphatidylserine/phosphatidylglycerophosphate/cardiolipin synthase-like enzyme
MRRPTSTSPGCPRSRDPARRLARVALLAALALAASACTRATRPADIDAAAVAATAVLGPDDGFTGSPYPEVGRSGLFPVREPAACRVAVLAGGEDSFAVRMAALRAARVSIRIQALVFRGDESGLRIAAVLKEKKAAGLDVRVIVDALSNPWLQAQWLFFDLKQHGIEVEGYEALGLQWVNEVPIPWLTPHVDPAQPNKRYHEKLWIIDGGTSEAVAVTGGLNIGNEYFRVDERDPDGYWRDQDVVVRGPVVDDLVATFDRNFDYLVGIKKSRGVFNTNLYWGATRGVLDRTGRLPVPYVTDPDRVARVARLEDRRPALEFRPATCRFLHSRPRFGESYIQQAYVKLIERARREVVIANAYFVPTPAIATALKDAARRCVAVRLLSNSPQTNDLPEITLVGRGYYRDLLAVNATPEVAACPNRDAGLRIWEWVGQAPDEPARTQGTLHAKFAVIDGRRSLVGSYNLDPRSERLNNETALVFEEPRLAARLRAAFYDQDLRYAREVSPGEAAGFERPEEVVYRFRKALGEAFEGGL